MSSLNNFSLQNKSGFFQMGQSNFTNIDTKRFTNVSALNDIEDLISKGQSKGLEEDEFNELIKLLESLNIDTDIEFEDVAPGQMPSFLSSTDAYTKVFKAMMEVMAKLREEEERQSKKIREELKNAASEEQLAAIKKDINRVLELMKSKEVKQEIIVDKNFGKINQFLDDIRQKYNIDLKNTISNPINVII